MGQRSTRRRLLLTSAAGLTAGPWRNTNAGCNIGEYFTEGIQPYFDVNRRGPAGGDGVHDDIATRATLRNYDRPLFNQFDRVYPGKVLGS